VIASMLTMKRLILATAIISVPAAGHTPEADKAWIWRALSTEAFNEMRCDGLSAEQARVRYDRKYKARQERIRLTLVERALIKDEDRILMGRRCPYYVGAQHRLKVALSDAERHLGLTPMN
jgi:hypothetical protein